MGFGGVSWGGGSRRGLRKYPCLLPSPRYPESSAQTARGEEGTGGGLGPLRKAVIVSCLLVAQREARGGDQGGLGAGHMWPSSSYWVSNGPEASAEPHHRSPSWPACHAVCPDGASALEPSQTAATIFQKELGQPQTRVLVRGQ